MVVLKFPPVTHADPSGLLAVGGDLEVPTLLVAYCQGVFPWPHEGYPLLWFAPQERAVLHFDEMSVPRRVRQYLKRSEFRLTVNERFDEVIAHCALARRKGQRGTWISDEMLNAYKALHQAGYAHSFETRDRSGALVGGMYGVRLGRMFCGESMFHSVDHASKFALIGATQALAADGLTWMDIQVMTPLLSQFGAREIERREFMLLLRAAISDSLPQIDADIRKFCAR